MNICYVEVEIFYSTIFIQFQFEAFEAFAKFAMFANLVVLFDFPFNRFVSFENRESEIRVKIQTCKRCKCFKRCKLDLNKNRTMEYLNLKIADIHPMRYPLVVSNG